MLCEGTVSLRMLFVNDTSARWVMILADVSCQRCAEPVALKLATLALTGVALLRSLLMTMSVSAPSEVRTALNAERLSGFGTDVRTLVSPNVDLLPS